MEKQEQAKPVRGQNLLEWYEALISAALVLVLIFSFFFRIIQVDGSSMVPTLVNITAKKYLRQRTDRRSKSRLMRGSTISAQVL